MLWDQTRQLPKELLKKVEETYNQSFSFEVRLNLATWIEEKFSPSQPFNPDDPADQKAAVAAANQLMTELDAKIAAIPNDPDKFLQRGKLVEIAENLRVSDGLRASGFLGIISTAQGQVVLGTITHWLV